MVQSGIIDISLHYNGRKIHLQNLQNPVSLYLPKKIANRKIKVPQEDLFLTPVKSIKQLNTSKHMNYHSIYIPSKYVTVTIRLVPEKLVIFEVYLKPNERPSPSNYSYFSRIPDLSVCENQSIHSLNTTYCSRDPYEIEINANITGKTGLYFIGIRALPNQTTKKYPVENGRSPRGISTTAPNFEKTPHSTSLDGVAFLKQKHRRHKRSCIKVKEPITLPPKLSRPIYNNKTDIKYKLTTRLSACLFWSEAMQEWNSRGCKVMLLCDVFWRDFFVNTI